MTKRFPPFMAAALLLAGCTDGLLFPPAPAPAELAIDVSRAVAAASTDEDLGEAFDRADRVRVRISREGSPDMVETVPFEPEGSEARIRISVDVVGDEEPAELLIELLEGSQPLFRDLRSVVLRRGQTSSVTATLHQVGPARVDFVAGTDQAGYPGDALSVAPAVRVTDGLGIPTPGVEVTFSADMGGTVQAPVAVTNADGVAVAGGWTLGDFGPNTLRASVAGGPEATLTVQTLDPCTRAFAVDLGETVTGTLVPGRSCMRFGALREHWWLTLPEATTFRTTLTASDYTPFVVSYPEGLFSGIGQIAGAAAPGSVTAEQVLPAGTYWLVARSLEADADDPPGGPYTLRPEAVAEPQVGCMANTSVTHGSVARGRITSADCIDQNDGEPDVTRRWDGYSILVYPGQTVSVTVTADFPVRLTRWFNGYQEGVFGIQPGQSGTITHTAPGQGFHGFYVISEHHEGTGAYTLEVSLTDPEGLGAHHRSTGGTTTSELASDRTGIRQ